MHTFAYLLGWLVVAAVLATPLAVWMGDVSGWSAANAACLAIGGGAFWLWWDFKRILREIRQRAEAKAVGDWPRLEAFALQRVRAWGPIEWVFRKIIQPGMPELQWAADLNDLGRYEEALTWLDRADVKLRRGDREQSRLLRANVLRAQARYDEALDVLAQTASDQAQLDPMLKSLIMTVLFRQGRFAEAEAHANALLQTDPTSLHACMTLFDVAIKRGNFQEAIAWACGGKPQFPGSPRQAERLRQSPDTSWIERNFLDDMNALSAFAVGDAAQRMGQLDLAEQALNRAAPLAASNWHIRLIIQGLRALVLAQRGDVQATDKALQITEKLALQGGNPSFLADYHEFAAEAWLHLGQPQLAQAHAMEGLARQIHPLEQQNLLVFAGRAAELQQHWAEARTHYQRAVDLGFDTYRKQEALQGLARLAAAR